MSNNNENKNNGNVNVKTPAMYLEQFINHDTRIFIDTCSMLDEAFPLFLNNVAPLLEKHENRIIVPLAVVKELVHHMDNPKTPELKDSAVRALTILKKDRSTYLRILGNEGDSFPDNLFQSLQIQYRLKYHMLFITQDRGLAVDILNNNRSNSVNAYDAIVKRITPQGYLNNMQLAFENGKWVVPRKTSVSFGNVFTKQSAGAFRTCDKPTSMQDDVLKLTEVPGEFDIVYAMNPRTEQFAEVELKELVASGGEGAVYMTNTKFVAKIYKEDKVTTRRREKVLMMTKKELQYGGICFPVIPLFNSHSEFVGYLMEKATGKELGRSVFCPYIKRAHSDWKREDLVQLCLTILKKIAYLHSKNILMGDINPGNILVNTPTEVYFVDTDSYQIEDLPCPVGQCNYTAPEIQGKEYNSFLRTIGNENFAVATLLFQILLPGKLPYAHAGGGKQNENILEMNFPYCLGENGNRNEPDGQWKFMWSHLSYHVKEAFYNTFQKGGSHSTEETRLTAAEWQKCMGTYHYLLREGLLAKNDPMSESIFPTRTKATKDAKWAVCRHCGEKFPYYTKKKDAVPPTHCPACKRLVHDWLVCEDCGEEFPLYVYEYEYMTDNGFPLPKRCNSCRQKRRVKAVEREKKAAQKRFGGLDFDMKTLVIPGDGKVPEVESGPKPSPVQSRPQQQPVPRPVQQVKPAPQPSPQPVQQFKPVLQPVVRPVEQVKPAPQPSPQPVQQVKPAPQPSPQPVQYVPQPQPFQQYVPQQLPPPPAQPAPDLNRCKTIISNLYRMLIGE